MEKKEKRREAVGEYVRSYTEDILSRGLPIVGLDAGTIARTLPFDRANISKELNELYRSGRMIKMLGKPTLYLYRDCFARFYPNIFIPTTIPKGTPLESIIVYSEADASSLEESPNGGVLERATIGHSILIDADSSMHEAFQQAKAAIAYPPQGLNMFICGNSGTGKMQFVRQLHEYSIANGYLHQNAPLVVCDCRDYGNSLQLLLSRIFGYARENGASSKSRRGMLEKADGGILCLKSVEYLPMQIMNHLALLLDTRTYNRVGESNITRTSNAIVIAVSSKPENCPETRRISERIPVHISIPDLNERNLHELLAYITVFFQRESAMVGTPFVVHKSVLMSLLCATYEENITELSHVIQAGCALAYLSHTSDFQRGNTINVQLSHFPKSLLAKVHPDIKKQNQAESMLELWPTDHITFSPQMYMPPIAKSPGVCSHSLNREHASPIPMIIAVYGGDIACQLAELIGSVNAAYLVRGINVPVSDGFDSLFERLENSFRSLDTSRGVLLATDIPALESMCDALQEKTLVSIQLLPVLRFPYLQSVCEQALTFSGNAKELFLYLNTSKSSTNDDDSMAFYNRIVAEVLAPSLTFLNPDKAFKILMETLSRILEELELPHNQEISIKFLFHCSHMLERLICGNAFKYEHLKAFANDHGSVYFCIEKHMCYPAEIFGITIPATEIAYIAELFVQMGAQNNVIANY